MDFWNYLSTSHITRPVLCSLTPYSILTNGMFIVYPAIITLHVYKQSSYPFNIVLPEYVSSSIAVYLATSGQLCHKASCLLFILLIVPNHRSPKPGVNNYIKLGVQTLKTYHRSPNHSIHPHHGRPPTQNYRHTSPPIRALPLSLRTWMRT